MTGPAKPGKTVKPARRTPRKGARELLQKRGRRPGTDVWVDLPSEVLSRLKEGDEALEEKLEELAKRFAADLQSSLKCQPLSVKWW